MVFCWEELFLNHCIPFGAASSNGIFGQCGDAIQHILGILLRCTTLQWVDDFVIIRLPPDTPGGHTSESDVYAIVHHLGWPGKVSKTKPFSLSFTYLGFQWDIPRRTVTVPASKCEKYVNKIHTWLANNLVSLCDTQQLIGSPGPLCIVITDCRAWLAGLMCFCASFSHRHGQRFLTCKKPKHETSDVNWWLHHLSTGPFTSSVALLPPVHIHPCYMDASTAFGIAIIVNNS